MFRYVLAAVCMAAPLAAGAQPPAPAPAAARPWQVDWGQYYCAAIRKADAGRPFATAFVTTPGMRGMHIALIRRDANGSMPAGITEVVLMPAGTRFTVTNRNEAARGGEVQRLYGLPVEFVDQLAGAEALELRRDGRLRERVPLDGVRAALAAHRQCLTAVAGEWGLDLAALAALGKRPDSPNGLGLTIDDYPAEALRQANQGRVVMRIDVSAAGRPTACLPVASSGSPAIDAAACHRAMSDRAQYMPALDADGHPVAARVVFMATFRLPDG
ncbi:energy transducer TonB [Allosphingosinicella sp.]|uniref:energy transducer TonB n=1 Tax=Allosphingosinicella sp. TaxID=2823234 RepID=UPI00378527C2